MNPTFRSPSTSDDDAGSQVAEELAFHLEMMAAELVRDEGLTLSEAQAEALRRFGDIQSARQYMTHQTRQRLQTKDLTMSVISFVQDVRMAVRTLRRNPGFSALVVFTLAAGITASTTIFSLISPYFLRPLPFEQPGALVQMGYVEDLASVSGASMGRGSLRQTADVRARSRAFQDVAAYAYREGNVELEGGSVVTMMGLLSANLMDLLGAEPELGRRIAPGEDGPDGSDVVVISHTFWQQRYGGGPGILGQTVRFSGTPYTVIGVMPELFNFPYGEVHLWAPIRESAMGDLQQYFMVGRLNEGWSRERAQAELAQIHAELQAEYPRVDGLQNALAVVPLREALNFVYDIMKFSSMALIAAVLFVLMIACVNVASLTLVRAGARSTEVAVRAAIGAGRGDLVRHLLAESVVLAALGGALGLGLTYVVTGLIAGVIPDALYRVGEISVDWRVLLFGVLVTFSTPLIFGLAPALAVSRQGLTEALKSGSRGHTGRRSKARRLLVVGEVALAVLLVSGAGLMVRSLGEVLRLDLGFASDEMLTVQVIPPRDDYADAEALIQFYKDAEERLGRLPGVVAVASVSPLPLNHASSTTRIAVIGGVGDEPDDVVQSSQASVTPGYFEAIGTPVLHGREFDDLDTRNSDMVAVVNRSFVRRHLRLSESAEGDAVGQTVLLGDDRIPNRIVGVVEDSKQMALDEAPTPQVFHSGLQRIMRNRHVVVRAAGSPVALTRPVQQALEELDSQLPVQIKTMVNVVRENTLQWALSSAVFTVLGFVALALAALGIYGVISYSVSSRTTEIGLRMALGAERRDVLRSTMGEGIRMSVVGVVVGLGLAVALGIMAQTVLFNVSPVDPTALIGSAVVFLVVAVLSSVVPAWRASRMDPLEALSG